MAHLTPNEKKKPSHVASQRFFTSVCFPVFQLFHALKCPPNPPPSLLNWDGTKRAHIFRTVLALQYCNLLFSSCCCWWNLYIRERTREKKADKEDLQQPFVCLFWCNPIWIPFTIIHFSPLISTDRNATVTVTVWHLYYVIENNHKSFSIVHLKTVRKRRSLTSAVFRLISIFPLYQQKLYQSSVQRIKNVL